MTREAVIVSTARTPIGRAYRGAFNDTDAPTLGGHAIAAAVERAGIDPSEVDDVVIGCAMQQGSSGNNIGRTAGVVAGLPSSVAGMSVDAVACAVRPAPEPWVPRPYLVKPAVPHLRGVHLLSL